MAWSDSGSGSGSASLASIPRRRVARTTAAPRLADLEWLDVLSGVFRTDGFREATLSRISDATGPQRASLSHRFPGGKGSTAATVAASDVRVPFVAAVQAAGIPAAKVRQRAENAIITVKWTLVVALAGEDFGIFHGAINAVPDQRLASAG